ncbi:hypothetical protein QBC33DRAFT_601374 [Phialemonium atrogriseum]|uniref:Uncharacterized protein n=1 Tax=Phialemonium atrogriseum TaxID=1093897 RepID=A0AAJ0BT19_9PEZI|nr:uncharacterized protein QBC33DRAFT_601374 [Phialemonium atrogriseum]KAK1762517.1 hypothetical protein QBC33DRAFT_601374 [Phialemonium atrogriseum]
MPPPPTNTTLQTISSVTNDIEDPAVVSVTTSVWSKDPPTEYNLAIAALEFEEFSFWGEDGSLDWGNASTEHNKALRKYLTLHYNVIIFHYCEPFLLLGCEGELPSKDKLPFSIAGMIAIWRIDDNMKFRPLIGWHAEGEECLKIDPGMLDKMVEHEIPPNEVFLYLADHIFHDCIAISIIWETMVVELPLTEWNDFVRRLQVLPEGIEGAPFLLQYHNGPLPNTERCRSATTPTPKALESDVADETDYVKADGRFYPGTMINSTDRAGTMYSSGTAGVLVEKDGEQRLTCSYHNWEDHDQKYPGRFGQDDDEARRTFEVVQGNPGTPVGFAERRMGDTDIALAKLNDGVVFENNFMEMAFPAKTLVPSKEQSIGDSYLIDSFTTGKQRLLGCGARITIRRRPGMPHYDLSCRSGTEAKLPPSHVAYIWLKQGAALTNKPVMILNPYFRDGASGAVLLRCGYGESRQISSRTVMERGEICGMMYFADIQAKHANQADRYVIYTDAFDPLIEEGWSIVQAPGADSGETRGTKEEESPAKKRKTASSSSNVAGRLS